MVKVELQDNIFAVLWKLTLKKGEFYEQSDTPYWPG